MIPLAGSTGKGLLLLGLSLFAAAPLASRAAAQQARQLDFVLDPELPAPARHGLAKLRSALRARNVPLAQAPSWHAATADTVLVAGLANAGGEATRILAQLKLAPPAAPESLLVRKLQRDGKTLVLAAGSDAVGLMYALLDLADRVTWPAESSPPFQQVRDTDESPCAAERALSLYTFQRAAWENRFHDEAYWADYLDLLANNRFNSLVVVFGYENGGFLAPCYPYFFDVDGFPDVRMIDLTAEQQQRNLAALNRILRMAHQRGIKFSVGIWDHIYRGGVQGGGIPGADDATKKPTPGLVWGVTADNLIPYTRAALAKFVREVPGLDGIQFRMHDESGLKNSEQEAFWRDVFRMLRQAAPQLRLDLRAKGLPDSVIQCALDTGVPFRIATKYWMEQMGLPFHPTHINPPNQFDRRHSYADLLRYPRRYTMHWRLWNGGTTRVLLWGDPDYARRFVASARLYDGDGFEVNEPLCTKMEAQPHDAAPFDLFQPAHRLPGREFERYWHFFQVFGRLGYNPDTPPEVWRKEFERRFGAGAAPFVEAALHQASKVLPRIVASCYPYRLFPMTRGWAEKQRLGDLPDYAKAEGSDVQQFASFAEEAQLLLAGGETAKTRPAANSRWFSRTANEIQTQLAAAAKHAGPHPGKEYETTAVDLQILAKLALYHSRRIPAAVNYLLFQRTKDPAALDAAIAAEQAAVDAWRQLVAAAGDCYADDLMMGVRGAGLCGHWRDELAALERGLEALRRQRDTLPPGAPATPAPRFTAVAPPGDHEPPAVDHRPLTTVAAGQALRIVAEARDPSGVKWLRLRYRAVNQREDFRTLPMEPDPRDGRYRAEIPADRIQPEWDLMYFLEAMDQRGNGAIYPDLDRQTPYFVVRPER